MVGTLRFAHPTDCELICLARKRNFTLQPATFQLDGQISETCPAPFAKIFRFRRRPNHPH